MNWGIFWILRLFRGGSVSIVVRDWRLWSDRSERPAGPLIMLLPVLLSEELLDCRRHLICLISDLIKCMSDLSLEFSDFILAFSALRNSFSVSRSCILEWRVWESTLVEFPICVILSSCANTCSSMWWSFAFLSSATSASILLILSELRCCCFVWGLIGS